MKKRFAAIAATITLMAGGLSIATAAPAHADPWGCNDRVNNGNIHPYYVVNGCPNYIKKYQAVAKCWPGILSKGKFVSNTPGSKSQATCFFVNVTESWINVIY